MRRTVLLLASTALVVLVAAGVALAATISCPNRAGNLCVGTDQADTLNGRDGAADDMRGRGGADTLRAHGANDKLTGGNGNDTLHGGLGSDTYLFDDGWGEDNIGSEDGGVDTLDFSALSAKVFVDLDAPAGEPEAASGTTNTLNINDTNTFIEKVRGGAGSDYIRGNQRQSSLANYTIFGNADADDLSGGGGNDALFGGAGGDALYGHWGNDSLAGGDGSDEYEYYGSDGVYGQETITDSPIPSDTDRYTGNQVVLCCFTADLTINLVSDPNQPEVTYTGVASPSSFINWSGSVIDRVDNQSESDDTVNGNSASNEIYSLYGNDTVRAGEGDDWIHVRDLSGGDEVYCGAGNDTVHFDSNDAISLDCEN